MYQLNYHSIAVPDITLEDLDQILETANTVNALRNITGCLIYHNNSFVQILEGNKKDVLQVYKNIKADKRHHTVTLAWEGDVESRFFADWNMAYFRPEDKNLQQFVTNLLLLSQLSDRTSGSLMSFWGSVRKIMLAGEHS